jgi:hypothetical protein
MKTILVSLLLVSAAAVASAGDNPSLSGKWQVHNSISGNESDQGCTFTQKDSDLTGSCSSDNGTVKISGKVDGKKVTWSYKSEYNGTPLTVTYEGIVESATKITGSVTVPEFSADGDFTATQSK